MSVQLITTVFIELFAQHRNISIEYNEASKNRMRNANELYESTCSLEGKKVPFQLAQSHNEETGYPLIGVGRHIRST